MPSLGPVGPLELIIVLAIALLLLGPKRLPELGSAVGKTIREFRKAAADVQEDASLDRPRTSTPESATDADVVPNRLTGMAPVNSNTSDAPAGDRPERVG